MDATATAKSLLKKWQERAANDMPQVHVNPGAKKVHLETGDWHDSEAVHRWVRDTEKAFPGWTHTCESESGPGSAPGWQHVKKALETPMTPPVGFALLTRSELEAAARKLAADGPLGPVLDHPLVKPVADLAAQHFPETTASAVGGASDLANKAVDAGVQDRIQSFLGRPEVQGAGIGLAGGAALGGLYGLANRRKNKWRAATDALTGGALGALGGGLLAYGGSQALGAARAPAPSATPEPTAATPPPPAPPKAIQTMLDITKPFSALRAEATGQPAPEPGSPDTASQIGRAVGTPLGVGSGIAGARYVAGRPITDKLMGGPIDPKVTANDVRNARLGHDTAAAKLKELTTTAAKPAPAAPGSVQEMMGVGLPPAPLQPKPLGELEAAQAKARAASARAAELAATRSTAGNVMTRRVLGGPTSRLGAVGEAGLLSAVLAAAGRKPDMLLPDVAGYGTAGSQPPPVPR